MATMSAAAISVADMRAHVNSMNGYFDMLLNHLETQVAKNSELQDDLEAEKNSRTSYQKEAKQLQEEAARYKRNVDELLIKNQFVVVLVDGDGAKFSDDLLGDFEGPQKAADNMKTAVRAYIRDHGLSEHVTIIVRVFAHIRGLGKALVESQVIAAAECMSTFAEKFTNSCAEFDFVNVGWGKENADSKIRRNLAHFYGINQCKKIFLAGCCHDNGYLHDLRVHKDDPNKKVVLVETTPAEPEFHSLGFPIIKFDRAFRSDPLNNETKRISPKSIMGSPTINRVNTVTHQPKAISSPPKSDDSWPELAPTSSVSSQGSAMKTSNGNKALLFSQAGGTTSHENVSLNKSKPQKRSGPFIAYGEGTVRVDTPLFKYSRDDPAHISFNRKLEMVKSRNKKDFCNYHYFSGHCMYGENCSYVHDVKLSKDELAIQHYRVRYGRPCGEKQSCCNAMCPCSHHCPFPKGYCNKGSACLHELHLSVDEMKPKRGVYPDDGFVEHLL